MKMLQKLFRTLHSTGNVVFGGCWIFTWPYWSWQRDTSSWQTLASNLSDTCVQLVRHWCLSRQTPVPDKLNTSVWRHAGDSGMSFTVNPRNEKMFHREPRWIERFWKRWKLWRSESVNFSLYYLLKFCKSFILDFTEICTLSARIHAHI